MFTFYNYRFPGDSCTPSTLTTTVLQLLSLWSLETIDQLSGPLVTMGGMVTAGLSFPLCDVMEETLGRYCLFLLILYPLRPANVFNELLLAQMLCWRLFIGSWLSFILLCKAKCLETGGAVLCSRGGDWGGEVSLEATEIISLLYCLAGLGSSNS